MTLFEGYSLDRIKMTTLTLMADADDSDSDNFDGLAR
jgi:hypothetical protein